VEKPKKTAAELEGIVKQRIGIGDFRVTVHPAPDAGWQVRIYGHESAEVHRCQIMADTTAVELCQHYDLDHGESQTAAKDASPGRTAAG
jgi:hypothetical protein